MTANKVLSKTQSLCPVCLKKIDAFLISKGEKTRMMKACPEHGVFETVVWKGSIPMEDWKVAKGKAVIKHPLTSLQKGCPYDCGLCPSHRQHTCTALIEITQRCNLNCRFCFADSKAGSEQDPTIDQIKTLYESVLKSSGTCNIQLSGGEPTLRNDLPLIIQKGKELGFPFIQVNTNGIRLAEDEKFAGELKSAGLDSIFLQFDGTDDGIYRKLRGRDLMTLKIKAIENCKKVGIGVVLVPTLVPGVNVDNIGKILDFALENIQAVRGVHFQPVSYFGRIPHAPEDKDRLTLPELIDEIEKQTNGRIKADSLRPPQCENSFCSFHGRYLYQGSDRLTAVGSSSGCCGKKAEDGALKAKVYVSQNWSSREADKKEPAAIDGWNKILDTIHQSSFSISAMAFQDVWNVDLNRVMDCCIHVVSPEGKLIPFCLYNLTDTKGRSLYREAHSVTQEKL